MSDAARRFFSADSLERAVLEAARHFGVAPEELSYREVEKRGATKRRKFVIRVDPEAPTGGGAVEEPEVVALPATRTPPVEPPPARASERAPAAERVPAAAAKCAPASAAERAPAPVRERPPEAVAREVEPQEPAAPARASAPSTPGAMEIRLPADAQEWFDLLPEADVEERVVAERWCGALLDLAGLELTARVRQGEDGLEVNLSGPDAEWLAEDEGEVLLALQHLLPRLMQSDLERLVSCRVDCGGFQLLREERLRARAPWAAEEVRSEGRAVTLEPMPPADRRIIHLALVNDATVETESLGRGYFKRVSVRPA
jgi:spoIIIJ-associated protein